MRWLCNFLPCRWTFLTNVMQSHLGHSCGLYQCARCKTVSVGWQRTEMQAPQLGGYAQMMAIKMFLRRHPEWMLWVWIAFSAATMIWLCTSISTFCQ